MEIKPVKSELTKLTAVEVSHAGRTRTWKSAVFDKAKVPDVNNIFVEINRYLSGLSENVQSKLFEFYELVYETMDFDDDFLVMQGELRSLVRDIYDIIDLDKLDTYCKVHANLFFPPDLKENYDETDSTELKKTLTYLRKDYYGLLYLSTAFKLMIPIWGEYIYRNRTHLGNLYKELMAINLLGNSKLFHRPEMDRLTNYLKARIGNGDVSPTIVHRGIGTAQLPEWLLGLTSVRRIALTDVSNPNINIISNIYMFITSSIDGLDKDQRSRVNDKKHPKDGSDSDENDNVSVSEMYKIKQEINDSYVLATNHYVMDWHTLAEKIEPGIDIKFVRRCVTNLTKPSSLDVNDVRIQLAALIVNDVFAARSLDSMSYESLLVVLGVVQAVMYKRGFTMLATLLVANAEPIPMGKLYGDGLTGESRSRITRENQEELMRIYPYYQMANRKQGRTKNDNVGVNLIENLNKTVQDYYWKHNNPKDIEEAIGVLNNNPLTIPSNFRNEVAEFIIKTQSPNTNTI